MTGTVIFGRLGFHSVAECSGCRKSIVEELTRKLEESEKKAEEERKAREEERKAREESEKKAVEERKAREKLEMEIADLKRRFAQEKMSDGARPAAPSAPEAQPAGATGGGAEDEATRRKLLLYERFQGSAIQGKWKEFETVAFGCRLLHLALSVVTGRWLSECCSFGTCVAT